MPLGVTREQAVGVVVQYIDGQPARMNENFVPLAIEALQATWPRFMARQWRPLIAALAFRLRRRSGIFRSVDELENWDLGCIPPVHDL